jgi:enoyl-CoA hydratase/carnithine racemase
MTTHFTVPISTGGQFVCTTPDNNIREVYILTFSSPPDNRLTSAFVESYILALDLIEHRLPRGVVICTSGISKFFSNGLDLEHVTETEGFWERVLWPLFRRLLT